MFFRKGIEALRPRRDTTPMMGMAQFWPKTHELQALRDCQRLLLRAARPCSQLL